ncbi:MAG: class I SAM-dependent methyltransferase [Clostridiales bacterium]|nr:class I SAM-dependent methyltransferase [Clostridiales bacterium]
MTNFDRVRDYYQHFDEDNRLKWDASGRLEYEMSLRILQKYLPEKGKILDLGGASGVYSFPLAEMGYEMYLADLSQKLIEQAMEKDTGKVLKSCDVVNAMDLSLYADDTFDAVIAFGPFYHLTEAAEREAAVREIYRVLKPGGVTLAAFIPYLSGSIAIVDRYVRSPAQVDEGNLLEVFRSGKFVNLAEYGFQEGFYAESGEMENLFSDCGFVKLGLRSVRGFAYEREEAICAISDPVMKSRVYELIEETSTRKEIVETCGHAVYVGKK